MPVDYTVIQPVRQRFGDGDFSSDPWDAAELEAPFVGTSKEFAFSCPNVDSSQMAVLHVQSFGVSWTRSGTTLEINRVPVPGGLRPGGSVILPHPDPRLDYSFWVTHTLLVEASVLEAQNVLRIESGVDAAGKYDDFIIDNVVIFFKTRAAITDGGLGGIRDIDPG